MTLTDYKSLFIYTHLYLQALIQVPSVTIQWNPGPFCWIPAPFHWIPADSCGIHRNPAEWMHSCRNHLWGIKKYSHLVATLFSVMWHLECRLAKGNKWQGLTVHADSIECCHHQMTPCCWCHWASFVDDGGS